MVRWSHGLMVGWLDSLMTESFAMSWRFNTLPCLGILFAAAIMGGCATNSHDVSEVPPPPTAPQSYPSPTEKPSYNPGVSQAPAGTAASNTRPVIYDYPGPTKKIGSSRPVSEKPQSAVVATAPTPASAGSGKTYTVQAGDTLWKIASKHGVNLQALKKANNLDNDVIKPGQMLQLP